MTKKALVVKAKPKLEKIADAAFENDQLIKRLASHLTLGFLEFGRLLKDNRDKNYYEALGYETFEEYIANPELSLSRTTIYRFIRVFEVYVEKLKLPKKELALVGCSKLDLIKERVNKSNWKKWAAKAQALSYTDLSMEVQEERDKKAGIFKRRPKMFLCKDHRAWIIDIDPEECCPDWVEEFVKKATKAK